MPDHPGQSLSHTTNTPFGWLVLVVPVAIWAVYAMMVIRQGQRGRSWPGWRSISFVAGIALTAAAVSPPVMGLAHHDLRGHMVQHLVLGMVAPLGLVLAAPVTLLLRTVPTGAGRAIARLLRSRPMRLLSHPTTALVLNIGGMYILYLTPLFALSMEYPSLHWLIMVHFLAAGYLFTWAIAGPDPAPHRPGITVRTIVLVLSLGLHAFLGKFMYAHLLPTSVPFEADQVKDAAVLMYYGGDFAEFLLAIVLFSGWYRLRQRQRQRAAMSRGWS